LEHWNIGTLEHWNIGTLEDWKIGRLEDWKIGRLEDWKIGKLENWKIGKLPDEQSENLAAWLAASIRGRAKLGGRAWGLARRESQKEGRRDKRPESVFLLRRSQRVPVGLVPTTFGAKAWRSTRSTIGSVEECRHFDKKGEQETAWGGVFQFSNFPIF